MIRKLVFMLLAVAGCQFSQAEQAPITVAVTCPGPGCLPYPPDPLYVAAYADTIITAKTTGCPLYTEKTTSTVTFYDDGTYKTAREGGLELTGIWSRTPYNKLTQTTFYMAFDDPSRNKILQEYQNAFTPCGRTLIEPSILTDKNSAKYLRSSINFFSTTIMSGKSINADMKTGGFKSKVTIKGKMASLY